MASDLLLPLFPLEVVLLPSVYLPLHIFEERYKLMIGEAVDRRSEFGIVLAKEENLASAGCSARVDRVLKRYPDGRLDVVARGERRFEILFLDEQKPYLQAAVHFFDDEPDSGPPPEASARLSELFQQAASLLSASPSPDPFTSFQVAAVLPFELDVKQQLLSSRSEADRVTLLCQQLEKLLPRLELTRRAERLSRGNGRPSG